MYQINNRQQTDARDRHTQTERERVVGRTKRYCENTDNVY